MVRDFCILWSHCDSLIIATGKLPNTITKERIPISIIHRSIKRGSIVLAAALGLSAAALISPTLAASIPTAQTVTLAASGSNAPGGAVTLTAQGTASSGSLWYAFWVQEPNGQWKQVQGWSAKNTYTMPNIQDGSYLVVVDALTPEQVKDGDWAQTLHAEQTINVGTSVAVTGITNALTSTGVTPGQPVTITAQAQNITNPVYQFWIEQNGQWVGTDYTNSSSYTFTPKTANFEVAVYAKTVEEPKNAGSGLGITPMTATTPQMFAMATAAAQAKYDLISILQGYPFYQHNDGISTPQLVGAPSPSIIDPLIPSSLPPNGTITGAAALLQANPNLLTQAQALAQPQGVTITPQVLEAGMHQAAQVIMAYEGNDPAALLSLLGPGLLLPDYKGSWVLPAVQNLLTPYQGGYSIEQTHNYYYDQSVQIQSTFNFPSVSASPVVTPAPADLPQKILDMTVPMTLTEVMNYQQSGDSDKVWTMIMQADATVTLYHDPLISGGLAWGMAGSAFNTKAISSSAIWPAS